VTRGGGPPARGGQPTLGGRLFVVATPIGNLGDVTYRAVDVLRRVPLVAAEDTRLTRRLLNRYEVATRAVSYHARNAAARAPELLDHLRSGADLAVVTDAGTPGVSDPGEDLVRAWAAEGGDVIPIPGASAVLAAAAASGVAGPRWSFEGFLPRSGRERRVRLARIAADDRATILFEAPSRVGATLHDLAVACDAGRGAAVCRELTKLHEEIRRGTLGDLARAAASEEIPARGEFVVVVGPAAVAGASRQAPQAAELEAAREQIARLRASGIPRGEATRQVAAATGLPRRHLYRERNE